MWVTSSLQKAICLSSTSFPWGSERDARQGNGCCCAWGARRLSAPAHTPVGAKQSPGGAQMGRCEAPEPSPQLLLSAQCCCAVFQTTAGWFWRGNSRATGCSWHRTGQRNSEQWSGKEGHFPSHQMLSHGSTPKPLRRVGAAGEGGEARSQAPLSILTHCTFQPWISNYSWKSNNISELIFKRGVLVRSGFVFVFFF